MDCNEVYERLSEYLDQDVREELARAIEDHRGHCRDCRVLIDTTRMTVVLYQADRQLSTPVAISQRLRQALSIAYRETMDGRTDV
ncbi:MAG: zf-HC2 domain-containing protein [Candidatus Eiseniibacteriota bacterium]